jgi:hypothetical protein
MRDNVVMTTNMSTSRLLQLPRELQNAIVEYVSCSVCGALTFSNSAQQLPDLDRLELSLASKQLHSIVRPHLPQDAEPSRKKRKFTEEHMRNLREAGKRRKAETLRKKAELREAGVNKVEAKRLDDINRLHQLQYEEPPRKRTLTEEHKRKLSEAGKKRNDPETRRKKAEMRAAGVETTKYKATKKKAVSPSAMRLDEIRTVEDGEDGEDDVEAVLMWRMSSSGVDRSAMLALAAAGQNAIADRIMLENANQQGGRIRRIHSSLRAGMYKIQNPCLKK